jgi:hypothetical protein
MSYSWFQTSQIGGRQYSDTSPLVFPALPIQLKFLFLKEQLLGIARNSLLLKIILQCTQTLQLFTKITKTDVICQSN